MIVCANDGNCLFEALCLGMHMLRRGHAPLAHRELERRKRDLRGTIARIICVERRDFFAPFCPHPTRIYDDGEWAGEHEIVAFCDHFRINVVVYDRNDQWEHVLHFPDRGAPHPSTIALVRTGQVHYSLLCDEGSADPRVLAWAGGGDRAPAPAPAPETSSGWWSGLWRWLVRAGAAAAPPPPAPGRGHRPEDSM